MAYFLFSDGVINKKNVEWLDTIELHDKWINIVSNMSIEQLNSILFTNWPFNNQSFYNLAL